MPMLRIHENLGEFGAICSNKTTSERSKSFTIENNTNNRNKSEINLLLLRLRPKQYKLLGTEINLKILGVSAKFDDVRCDMLKPNNDGGLHLQPSSNSSV